MSAVWLGNLAAYSVQLAVLVVSAVLADAVLRLRAPRAALSFWQLVLIAAVVLPFAQAAVVTPSDTHMGSAAIVALGLDRPSMPISAVTLTTLVIATLACGAALRVGWLALGLLRLGDIRRRSQPLSPVPVFVADLTRRLGTSAEIRTSDDVDGPVTIGLMRPVILLPHRALTLPAPVQQAIVCHELVHVRRRDWAMTLAEQLWCGLLWFHPAAHLLVARIVLMRETLVDRDTLALTGDRRAYAQALLAFAEAPTPLPIAVPSLIRRRHLSRRIAAIAQEAPMSHRHVTAALIAGFTMISAATAAGVSRFPMTALPAAALGAPANGVLAQEEAVRPGNGVSVPRVVKEVRPVYTPAALQAKIQGSVEVELVVSADGVPGRIVVTKSLDAVHGLDESAIEAASQWRFEPGRRDGKAIPVLIAVEMRFTLR